MQLLQVVSSRRKSAQSPSQDPSRGPPDAIFHPGSVSEGPPAPRTAPGGRHLRKTGDDENKNGEESCITFPRQCRNLEAPPPSSASVLLGPSLLRTAPLCCNRAWRPVSAGQRSVARPGGLRAPRRSRVCSQLLRCRWRAKLLGAPLGSEGVFSPPGGLLWASGAPRTAPALWETLGWERHPSRF